MGGPKKTVKDKTLLIYFRALIVIDKSITRLGLRLYFWFDTLLRREEQI